MSIRLVVIKFLVVLGVGAAAFLGGPHDASAITIVVKPVGDNCWDVYITREPSDSMPLLVSNWNFSVTCPDCQGIQSTTGSGTGSYIGTNLSTNGNQITGTVPNTTLGVSGSFPNITVDPNEETPIFNFCCDSDGGVPTITGGNGSYTINFTSVPEMPKGVVPMLGVILLGASLRLRRRFVSEGLFRSRNPSP